MLFFFFFLSVTKFLVELLQGYTQRFLSIDQRLMNSSLCYCLCYLLFVRVCVFACLIYYLSCSLPCLLCWVAVRQISLQFLALFEHRFARGPGLHLSVQKPVTAKAVFLQVSSGLICGWKRPSGPWEVSAIALTSSGTVVCNYFSA